MILMAVFKQEARTPINASSAACLLLLSLLRAHHSSWAGVEEDACDRYQAVYKDARGSRLAASNDARHCYLCCTPIAALSAARPSLLLDGANNDAHGSNQAVNKKTACGSNLAASEDAHRCSYCYMPALVRFGSSPVLVFSSVWSSILSGSLSCLVSCLV